MDLSGVKQLLRNETTGSLAMVQRKGSIDAGRRCTLANQLLKCTLGRLRDSNPT